MTVVTAENAGFCFGVKRATECVERLIEENKNAKIYTLGKLIHNDTYIKQLEESGVFCTDISNAKKIAETASSNCPAILVLRAHGITKQDEKYLRELETEFESFNVIDMTCPYVKRIHKIAEQNTDGDTLFLLMGSAEHPEIKGILSYAKGSILAVNSLSELEAAIEKAKYSDRIRLIMAAQTTQNTSEWKKCQNFIKKLYTNAKIFDTICNVTENRQKESAELSSQCDAMIVIGGAESSNTKKLYEICKDNCPDTVWIQGAEQICLTSFSDKQLIGITAGASTPAKLIMEVQNLMNTNNELDFEQMLEESLKPIHTGDTVTGTVEAVTDTEVKVDIGAKFTGIISRDQATADTSANLKTLFRVGDEITAFVIRVEDSKGTVTLSKTRIDNDMAWKNILDVFTSGEEKEVKITDAVKGGVLADLDGFKVFIPASQVSLEKIEDLSTVVGQVKKIKIIDVDKQKKRAIASAKVIENAIRKEKQNAIWETLSVGDKFMGKVKNFIPHGAFVDIGGVDGFIPNIELSWRRIKHPSQILQLGQEVAVTIKELDKENRKMTLGYRTEEMDPFFHFKNAYKVGDVVDAKIVSMTPFGAFGEVMDGADGLIHISKISRNRITKPEEVLSIGQVVKAKITEIDVENRKFSLSIRALEDEEYNRQRAEERARERAEREEQRRIEAEEKAKLDAEMAPYIVRTID